MHDRRTNEMAEHTQHSTQRLEVRTNQNAALLSMLERGTNEEAEQTQDSTQRLKVRPIRTQDSSPIERGTNEMAEHTHGTPLST
jgi:hypothetical protein